jgi:hypothetical protein
MEEKKKEGKTKDLNNDDQLMNLEEQRKSDSKSKS